MKWETQEYVRKNGRSPIRDYLSSLSTRHRVKVLRSIQLLEEFGPDLGMPHVRHLEDGIFELRTQFGNNIFRTIFFHWYENKLVLTHGFTKKTQKTPRSEIEKAKMYRADFLKRKGEFK